MKDRILIKHDRASNWEKAINFIPLAGEIIIYDGVILNKEYIEQPRLKIGDGIHKVSELPFLGINETAPAEISYSFDEDAELLEIN